MGILFLFLQFAGFPEDIMFSGILYVKILGIARITSNATQLKKRTYI